jgi:putative hemolysin
MSEVSLGSTLLKRIVIFILASMLLAGAVTACSSPSKSSSPPAAAAQTSASTASASSGSCAEAGTRKIPKTRLLTDLALTYGPFHRYLYKPYQAGTFHKGASGRTTAIIKAGLASAAIVKLLSNASQNAAADPTLCKYVPNINNIKSGLSSLAGKIKGGTATSGEVSNLSGQFDQLQTGAGFTPSDSSSLPGLG